MSVDLGTARAKVVLDTSQLSAGVSAASAQFSQLEGSTKGLSSSLSTVAAGMALIGGAIAVGVGGAVKTFGDFEQQINALGAVTGASAAQMQQLSDLALQIGKDTAFGASEAATALTELAKAGVAIPEILAGAGRAAVDLATATGVDLPTAANALANSLNLFAESGLSAADAVDILTAAANASSADLGGLQQGLRNLGPIVANMHGTFRDAAAAIAYFTNFGLKAADVGVSLAAALNHIAAPTTQAAHLMHELGIAAFDAQGKFVGFPALFAQLHGALANLSDAQRTLAITTIFGAEAQDVVNIAVREGAAGYTALEQAITPAGQAAAASAARMQGLNGALEQMKGSVETAAIAFGSALAPAVEAAAGQVERAANAFAALSPQVQHIAAVTVAAAGGFLLIGAAVAKIAITAVEGAAAMRTLAAAILDTRLAMLALEAATGPVGVAIAAVSLVLGSLVLAHQRAAAAAREHAAALREADDAFVAFKQFVAELRIQGLEDAANAAEKLNRNINTSVHYLDDQAQRMTRGEAVTGQLVDAWQRGQVSAKGLADASKALGTAQDAIQNALKDTRLDTVRLAQDFQTLVDQLSTGQITSDQFTAKLEDITTHLDRYTKTVTDVPQANQQAGQSFQDLGQQTDEATKAQQRFADQVDQTTAAALATVAGIQDIGTAIDGMQAGFGKAGDSFLTLLDKMARAGAITFTPAQQQAVDLARSLERLEARGAALHDQIAQNQGDIQGWAANIQLVTDVLGGNAQAVGDLVTQLQEGKISQDEFNAAVSDPGVIGDFEKLNALLAQGKISQEEYTKAKAAGIHLLERSAGGIQDENAQLADNLIALDAYIGKHDDAYGAVQGLSEAQQGFLAALQSSDAQTALNTLNLVAYLAVLGLIPAQKVTEFIADASQASPVVAALFNDLGLIPGRKTTAYEVTGDGTAQTAAIAAGIKGIPDTKAVTVDVSLTGDGTDVAGKLDQAVPAVTVPTTVAAPDTSAVDNYKPAPVEIPTHLGAPLADLVDNYHHDPIDIPTTLGAPDAAALTDYHPTPVVVDTVLGTPHYPEGAVFKAPDAVTIDTVLGAPDHAAVDAYVPPTIAIPTTLVAPGQATVGAQAAVDIPTKLDAPDPALVDAYVPAAITIPTELGTPAFPEGMVFKAPDPVHIGTVLDAPDTTPLETFAASTYTAKLDTDATDATTHVGDAIASAQGFADATYAATLDVDNIKAKTHVGDAIGSAQAFADSTYTATLDAATADALNAIDTAITEALAFQKTYTATLVVDTSAVLPAVTGAANLLPSSPAKTGPLSKDADFTYVFDAFVASMQMIEDYNGKALDLGPAVTASLRASDVGLLTAAGGGGVAAQASGGTPSIMTNFVALHHDDFAQLLANAEMGGDAFDWIIRREHAFATVGA